MSWSVSETLLSTIFEDCFPPYVLTGGSQFNVILTKKTLLFKFLWLEFRFKSFLKLHVHLKGFICIHMRKLHVECQIPADEHDWCQIVLSLIVPKFVPKYWTTKKLSQFLGWSVRTLAQYTYTYYIQNFKTLASFCSWSVRFESHLVGNLKTGFLVTWHISFCLFCIWNSFSCLINPFSPVDYSILINWMSSFLILGVSGVLFHFC